MIKVTKLNQNPFSDKKDQEKRINDLINKINELIDIVSNISDEIEIIKKQMK